MRIIAFYLPQFHRIPENDKWWGEGFTDWDNLKKAKPVLDGQYQPRVPLNDNYYDLSDESVMTWQVGLAKKYGVYGFCFYHYWYSGHLLLEKPVEAFLRNKEQDLPFCMCWANHDWTNSWVARNPTLLLKQEYGGKEDWRAHFDYLLPYFKDPRYIKNDNKPLFVIFKPEHFARMNEMLACWNSLALDNGFGGIDFAYQGMGTDLDGNGDNSAFTYDIEYQPTYAMSALYQQKFGALKRLKREMSRYFKKLFNIDLRLDRFRGMVVHDYDKVWNRILNTPPFNEKSIPGAFVDWDNTPRRMGGGASMCMNASPQKFQKYLARQIKRAKEVYHTDMLFIFAWNEWTEAGYLEPDKKYRYGYLEAVMKALEINNEFTPPPHNNQIVAAGVFISPPAKWTWYKTVIFALWRVFVRISPKTASAILFYRVTKKWLNLKVPVYFDEKLMALKFCKYADDQDVKGCIDKYKVRDFVNNRGCGQLLNELYGVWDNVEEIDWEALPQKFALKCTHGCAMNIICSDKNQLDVEMTKKTLKKWLRTEIWDRAAEVQYRGIKGRIICEKYLETEDGLLPNDYKIYCFDGDPLLILVYSDRVSKYKIHMYDSKWNRVKGFLKVDPDDEIERPTTLSEMIEGARLLSKGFPFVRVDFYQIHGKVIFGEMTFTPGCCSNQNYSKKGQIKMGEMLQI